MPAAPYGDRARFDARDKVLGRTRFTADLPQATLLYAMPVPARVAKGRLTALSTEEAMRVPGVVRILTAADFPPPPPPKQGQGPSAAPPPPTIRREIGWRGEPVALVLADTLEAAIEGAEAVRATYAAEPFSSLITSAGAKRELAEGVEAGNAARAMTRAETTVEVEYEAPSQHHNPIEMLSTTAVWSGGRLTVYEATQGASVVKQKVCESLRLDPAQVDIISSYVGGGFGQKGAVQRQVAIVARAAMLTGRPVKLLMPRGQVFHNAPFRPRSRHRIKLGADAAGKMVAVEYDADHQQSRRGAFPPEYHESPVQLYGIADYGGTAANVRIDTQAPGYMRAPHEHPACFAFEGAVDELAYKLGVDPVAFRLRHDTTTDPTNGKPLSSRYLHECIREGARRFGWDRRNPRPASTVLPDGTQVGWGVGCGAYPVMMMPNVAKLRIGADGTTRLAMGGQEMGQGIRTIIAAVLLRELDIDPTRLELVIGDTSVTPQSQTAGSWGTNSAAPIAAKIARQAKAQIAELLAGRTPSGNVHRQLAAVRRPFLDVEVSNIGPGQTSKALQDIRDSGYAIAGPHYPDFSSFSYSAHFAEVRVEPRTRRIRVPRVVSIADCGRVISPRTAASQVRGGVVWAIGSALFEETEVDPRYGGWLNNDIADYVMPVNADIGEIEVGFIDKPDPLTNTIGSKGLGEVAMSGASAAIANAIFHATGRRIRKMPIRIEDLL